MLARGVLSGTANADPARSNVRRRPSRTLVTTAPVQVSEVPLRCLLVACRSRQPPHQAGERWARPHNRAQIHRAGLMVVEFGEVQVLWTSSVLQLRYSPRARGLLCPLPKLRRAQVAEHNAALLIGLAVRSASSLLPPESPPLALPLPLHPPPPPPRLLPCECTRRARAGPEPVAGEVSAAVLWCLFSQHSLPKDQGAPVAARKRLRRLHPLSLPRSILALALPTAASPQPAVAVALSPRALPCLHSSAAT